MSISFFPRFCLLILVRSAVVEFTDGPLFLLLGFLLYTKIEPLLGTYVARRVPMCSASIHYCTRQRKKINSFFLLKNEKHISSVKILSPHIDPLRNHDILRTKLRILIFRLHFSSYKECCRPVIRVRGFVSFFSSKCKWIQFDWYVQRGSASTITENRIRDL